MCECVRNDDAVRPSTGRHPHHQVEVYATAPKQCKWHSIERTLTQTVMEDTEADGPCVPS